MEEGLNPETYIRAAALGADSFGTERTDAFFGWLDSLRNATRR